MHKSLVFIIIIVFCTDSFAADARTFFHFYHTHTKERFTLEYREDRNYLAEDLAKLYHFLRDHRTDEQHTIDIALLDILYRLKQITASTGDIEIISAFRSANTNEMLRNSTSGVAKRSLHLKGRAMDIRFSDITTEQLRDAGNTLQAGGVGYYPASNFIHIDTGRARFW